MVVVSMVTAPWEYQEEEQHRRGHRAKDGHSRDGHSRDVRAHSLWQRELGLRAHRQAVEDVGDPA